MSITPNGMMNSSRIDRRLVLFLAAVAWLAGTGCSRLLPVRHGEARSDEIIIDTRQDPSESLSGHVIPEVSPAYTKWPVMFTKDLPANAVFTDVTCETTQSSGDALAVLKTVVENGQIYLEFAVPKVDSVTQAHVVVHANYDYRW
jgi:hypothetical protein